MRGFSAGAGVLCWVCFVAVPDCLGVALYEQTPASAGMQLHAASQDFPDESSFTIIAADDFAVPAGAGWSVEALGSWFTTGNSSGLPADGIRWMIWSDDNGEPGAELLNLVDDGYDPATGLADVDLTASGSAIDLAPGTYWFASQIIGEIGLFGQEFHAGSLDGAGTANFLWSNPGGGHGFPVGWLDANGTINPSTGQPWSDVSNLAFSIGGTVVPEPMTLGLLMLGSLVLLRRRRA